MASSEELLTLGAIRWFKQNRAITGTMYPNLNFPTDHTSVDVLLQRGIPEKELKALGKQAKRLGCTLDRELDIVEINDSIVSFPPPTSQYWSVTDGTEPESSRETELGPVGKNNSCALDAAIMAAVFLNGARCQADQLSHSEVCKIPAASSALRNSLSMPWVSLTPTEMGMTRDAIRKLLNQTNSHHFPLTNFMEISMVMKETYQGLRQLQYTRIESWTCEHGRQEFGKSKTEIGLHNPLETLSYLSQRHTLEQRINMALARLRSEDEIETQCPDSGCSSKFCQQVIVGSLPPVIMLSEDWQAETFFPGHFRQGNVSIKWTDINMEDQVSIYKVVGVICHHVNHFTVNWQLESGRTVQYTGHAEIFEGQQMGWSKLQSIGGLDHGTSGAKHAATFLKLTNHL